MAKAYNKVTREWTSTDTPELLSADWVIDPIFENRELAMSIGQAYWQFTGNTISTISQAAYDAQQAADKLAKNWALIQAERERRIYTLGVLVGANQFNTDPTSRVQFVALAAFGNSMPTGIMWKTMSGVFIQMTPALASQIVSAIGSMDSAIFAFAEQKKAALYASADPDNFDIYSGWPTTFTQLVISDLSGTFNRVTTDSVGRVVSGTNPTTLSGHGITDGINISDKGAANGVATLGSDTKVPSAQLPAIVSTISSQSIATRPLLSSTVDFSGILQPILARNKVGYWSPPGNATTAPGVFGITAPTGIGTATARTVTTTNLANRMRRIGYPSAATAGSFSGVRMSVAQFTCGSGVARDGSGFTLVERWVESTPAVVAGQRAFVGMSSNTAAPTNVEVNTLTNSIGIGQLSTDATQWYWIQGGSVAQTAVAIGTSIGAPGGNSTTVWELATYCPNSVANTYYLQLTNVSTGANVSITMSGSATVVPQSTTLLAHRHWGCNNATLLSTGMDLCSLYIETDN